MAQLGLVLGVFAWLGASANASEPADAGAPCARWMASIRPFDDACDTILHGEPEDAAAALPQLFGARSAGDDAGVAAIEGKFRGKAAALARLAPPPELAELHRRLIAYFRAVDRAADAILRKDASPCSEPVRGAYQALYDYYHEVLGIIAEHQCDRGDVEAVEKTILPQLRAILDADWKSADCRPGRPSRSEASADR